MLHEADELARGGIVTIAEAATGLALSAGDVAPKIGLLDTFAANESAPEAISQNVVDIHRCHTSMR